MWNEDIGQHGNESQAVLCWNIKPGLIIQPKNAVTKFVFRLKSGSSQTLSVDVIWGFMYWITLRSGPEI